jgi:hypothetical protein
MTTGDGGRETTVGHLNATDIGLPVSIQDGPAGVLNQVSHVPDVTERTLAGVLVFSVETRLIVGAWSANVPPTTKCTVFDPS